MSQTLIAPANAEEFKIEAFDAIWLLGWCQRCLAMHACAKDRSRVMTLRRQKEYWRLVVELDGVRGEYRKPAAEWNHDGGVNVMAFHAAQGDRQWPCELILTPHTPA